MLEAPSLPTVSTVTTTEISFPFALLIQKGSGCGSVGRAVASDSRPPQFESSLFDTKLCSEIKNSWNPENETNKSFIIPKQKGSFSAERIFKNGSRQKQLKIIFAALEPHKKPSS